MRPIINFHIEDHHLRLAFIKSLAQCCNILDLIYNLISIERIYICYSFQIATSDERHVKNQLSRLVFIKSLAQFPDIIDFGHWLIAQVYPISENQSILSTS